MSAAPPLPPDYRDDDVQEERQPSPPRRPAWKRVLLWSGVVVLGLLLLVVIAVLFFVRSDSGRQYVLNEAQKRATQALGSDVQVGNFDVSFSGISPTINLYDVAIAGAPPYPKPPLLTIDHVRAGVRVVSLLDRKWYLSEVVVEHPVVRIFVDEQGRDNIPKPETGESQGGGTNLFDLAIRHAVLDQGELYYNNEKSAIEADLHSLDFLANFDTTGPRYYGRLSYENGHLKMQDLNTIPHSLSAEFEYAPDRVSLENAVLRSGSSRFTVDATVTNLDNPQVQAEYTAEIHAGEFRRIFKNETVPTGTINLKGSLAYDAKPNVPMLEAVNLQGTLTSGALQVQTPEITTTVRNLNGSYSVQNGNLRVRNLQANIMGGSLNADLTMRNLSGASKSYLSATLRNVSLSEAKSILDSPAVRRLGITGSLDAQAEADWGESFSNLVATADADLQARITPATSGAQSFPVTGVVHARYSGATEQVTLRNSFLRMPETTIALNGTVSERSSLQVRLRAGDLHRLETIAAMFQTDPQRLDLHGTAVFNGSVTGSTSRPTVRGQLVASNLRVRGSEWRSLRADVVASPSRAVLRNGQLVGGPRSQLNFELATDLSNWSFTETSQFELAVKGSQLNVGNLVKAAGAEVPASGTLNVNVQAQGTQLNPVGEGIIELTKGEIAGEPIQNATVKFEGTGDVVQANLNVRVPAGTATGVVEYLPKQQAYEAKLQANGIRLSDLETIKQRNLDLTGVLNVTASGQGTIKNPQMVATATIPKLTVQGQTFSGITLQGNVADQVAKVTLDSQVINTNLEGRATINLTGNYETVATLDTQRIPLQPLVALYAPEQASNLTGQTEVHASLRGPIKNIKALEGRIEIPTLNLNYKKAVQIGVPQPIVAELDNGVLQVQKTAIRGTGTDLQFQGRIPVADRSAPMSLLLQGTMDLRLAEVLNPEMQSSGQLVFDINSFGQRSDPNVQGQIRIVNASIATGEAPVGLQNGNGILAVTDRRLQIKEFEGRVGGGKVQASGAVTYRPSLVFDVALVADDIRMLYPDGVRSGLSANMTLTGTPEESYLRGQVNVDQLSFTPGFELMEMMSAFGGNTPAPARSRGFSNNMQLQLTVGSTQGINLSSRELTLQGGLNLNVTGTAADPVVLGRVNLTSGDLIFRGNRYVLQNATVDFLNPTRTEAVVNASLETTVDQYNIAMHFQGPVDRMRTSYTADPALPPADIINLLAFGETTEAASANPNPPGNLGAQSAIASAVAGQVTSRLEKIAGISHLSIDPTLGGTGSGGASNPGATITIQQRVTSKFFVTFSTDVTSTDRQVVQLQYRVSPRFSVSGTRDQNGGFAVDTRFRRTW